MQSFGHGFTRINADQVRTGRIIGANPYSSVSIRVKTLLQSAPATGRSNRKRLQVRERTAPSILRRSTELFLDAQQLVVLGDAVGAAQRAGLDLRGRGRDGEVR